MKYSQLFILVFLISLVPFAELFHLLFYSIKCKRYNIQSILKGSGTPHTEESKAKISAANKGKQSWNIGLKHSPETKQRIAEKTKLAMIKRKEAKAAEQGMTIQQYDELKLEKKKEIRELKKKQKMGLSEEGRKKISESTKKRWNDEGYRERYTLKMTGNRNHTAETRARISAKIKLKWQTDEIYRSKVLISPTDEIKAKISATLKAKWANPEYRMKMSNVASSRSLEWRQSIADSIREKWKDPEYRSAVLGAARNCTYVVRGSSRAKTTAVLDPEEAMRRKVERNRVRREKERARRQLISAAKKESRNKQGSKSIQEILGRELWFEEKLRRKKTGGMFLDDSELEKQLTDEWQEKEDVHFEEEYLLGKKAKRSKVLLPDEVDEELELEEEEEGDVEYDELEDELTPDDLYDRPHRDSIDDDIIEVYDQNGELVGTYTASEFEKMRAERL